MIGCSQRTRFLSSVGFAVALLGARPFAQAEDRCASALRRVETSSPHALQCAELHTLDAGLRTCSGSDVAHDRLVPAQQGVSVALRRCFCMSAPAVDQLASRFGSIHSPRQLALAESIEEQVRRCTPGPEPTALISFRAAVESVKEAGSYCSGSEKDWDRISRAVGGNCYQAQLDQKAFGHWLACGGAADANGAIAAGLATRRSQACQPSVAAASCETMLVIANKLRQSLTASNQRQLWNVVATQLLSAVGAGSTHEDGECATRMIAAASDGKPSDIGVIELLMNDPALRAEFLHTLQAALKGLSSQQAKDLMHLLDDKGVDVKKVLEAASRLHDDERYLFFNAAGWFGHWLQNVQAFSALEQNTGGFDVVISPRPQDCKYAEFDGVLARAFARAGAKDVAFDRERLSSEVDDRIATRKRSCGKNAPNADQGPGCGVVIAVQLIDVGGTNRAIAKAQLHYVAAGAHGGAVSRELASVQLPPFEVGCAPTSQETAAAAALRSRLQQELANRPRDSVALVATPIEVCGLKPLAPTGTPVAGYRTLGIRVEGDLAKLDDATRGAREGLQIWKDAIGPIDAANAATLLFSSIPAPQFGETQVNADLTLQGHKDPTASFAVVVRTDAPDCRASVAERQLQAGLMIGTQVGSFLASMTAADRLGRDRPPPARSPPPPRRWILPTMLAAADLGLVVGGLFLVSSAVNEQNHATARGLDPAASNRQLKVGRGLLIGAAAGAVVGAVYAIVW